MARGMFALLCGLWLLVPVAGWAAGDGQPSPVTAIAADAEPDQETWAVHGQFTNVNQYHPAFSSPYRGENSLDPNARSAATNDVTMSLGVRPWQGAELWISPEYDQGFGLSNTLGMAGYASGEAYKVGANYPYLRLPRAFYRQIINLGGEDEAIAAGANQLAGKRTGDNVTITLGKFSVVDIFDTNSYAHDPRADFLNWSVVESGAFDYAADSWGFTWGGAIEWTQSWWTLRGGFFALSDAPNSKYIDTSFDQFEAAGEFEARHDWLGRPGKVKLLAFVNHGRMGNYRDAVALARQDGGAPNIAAVRRVQDRPGVALNLEQELAADLGFFARASANVGSKEAFDFTEINRSVSMGLSLRGDRWQRHDDTLGLALVMNGLSGAAREYFAAGGMGILIGDGGLNYGAEKIAEIYYALHLSKQLTLSADYQYVQNPAYNRDRVPLPLYGVRVHVEF